MTNGTNTLFRALLELNKATEASRELSKEKQQFLSALFNENSLVTTKNIIEIKNDWIDEIEKGLVFIEKAIEESRQFIRSNGEVVPIEKVKRVSKDSVEHLARHSDLITKKTDRNDFIPDKLYMVERLSDFTVYENRFLYMLLVYLKSFVSIRYEKLVALSTSFKTELNIDKTVNQNNQKSYFCVRVVDERLNDPYLKMTNPIKSKLLRIEGLLKGIMHLINTELMQEVAKVPILKPPITKTNVLKMNKNFKGAVALYDVVSAYNEDGFLSRTEDIVLNPILDEADSDFSEGLRLILFLTYRYGLNLDECLRTEYEAYLEKLKAEETQRLIYKIESLRAKINESGASETEYLLLLESRISQLELENETLLPFKDEADTLRTENEGLNQRTKELNIELKERDQKIENLINEQALELARLRFESEKALKEQSLEFEAKMTAKEKEYNDFLEQKNNEFDALIQKKEEEINKERQDKVAEIEKIKAQNDELITDFEKKINDSSLALSEKIAENEALSQKIVLLNARINALKRQYNQQEPNQSFTSLEAFLELEEQYEAFKRLFKEEWKKTKKEIRKNVFK